MTNTFQLISPCLAFFHKGTSSPQSSRELKVFDGFSLKNFSAFFVSLR